MKILSFLTLMLLLTLSINAQTATTVAAANFSEVSPALVWDQTTKEFGSIQQNNPVTAEFVVTNESEEPVIITNVKSTCGCTVPSYQKEPLLPGEHTIIKATYNAKKEGVFKKTVKVFTSASETAIPLTLKGKVEKVEALSATPQ